MGSISKKAPSDESRWICLYPSYINAKKTTAEGRRIAKEKAVDNPTSQEIHDILKNSGLNVKLEKKMYPREWIRDWNFQGRVRVQLRNEDGSLAQPQFASRTAVMLHAAEMIPKLKSRQSTGAASAGAKAVDSSAGENSGGGQKKKGKKR